MLLLLLLACRSEEESSCIRIGDVGYASIQDALFTAAPGDVIDVCAGTVDGFRRAGDASPVHIRGAGMDATVIDGGGFPAAEFQGVDLRLLDLTLTGGYADYTFGVDPEGEATTEVVGTSGGAIRTWGGSATLERVRVVDNVATGGAVMALHWAFDRAPTLTLRDCIVERNYSEDRLGMAAYAPRVVSEDTDWGVGENANLPYDVIYDRERYDFEGVASFVCSDATGTCE
jgi:hypothetical protein